MPFLTTFMEKFQQVDNLENMHTSLSPSLYSFGVQVAVI